MCLHNEMKGQQQQHCQKNDSHKTSDEFGNIVFVQGIEILNHHQHHTSLLDETSISSNNTSVISSLGEDDSWMSLSDESSNFDDDAYHERGAIDDFDEDDDRAIALIHRRVTCASLVVSSQSVVSSTSNTHSKKNKDRCGYSIPKKGGSISTANDDKQVFHHDLPPPVVCDNATIDTNNMRRRNPCLLSRSEKVTQTNYNYQDKQKQEEEKFQKVFAENKLKKNNNKHHSLVLDSTTIEAKLHLIRSMELIKQNTSSKKVNQEQGREQNDGSKSISSSSSSSSSSISSKMMKKCIIALDRKRQTESLLRSLLNISPQQKSSLSDLFQRKTSRAA